jgi:thiol-disulfide isomerase/thioredoxin
VNVLPADLNIYSIEVFDHRKKLEKLGVNLNKGVPRLLVYDRNGRETLFQGVRKVDAVLQFIHDNLAADDDMVPGMVGGGAPVAASPSSSASSQTFSRSGVILNDDVLSMSDISEPSSPAVVSVSGVSDVSEKSDKDLKGAIAAGSVTIESMLTSLDSVTSSTTPTLVLFFSHDCFYCKKFMPTFLEFASSPPANVEIKAIDVAQNPDALMSLEKQAQSPGVPHVVMFQQGKPQVPFTSNRTVDDLNAFVSSNVALQGGSDESGSESGVSGNSGTSGDHGEGRIEFAEKPKRTSIRLALSDALDSLVDMAADELGDANRKLFEPKHTGVCFIGWLRQSVPANDRLVIVLIPQQSSVEQTEEVMSETERRKLPIFAVLSGKRSGKMSAQIYNSILDPTTLIRRKLKAKYKPAAQTDAATQAMHDMQYKVRVDDGSAVCVFD